MRVLPNSPPDEPRHRTGRGHLHVGYFSPRLYRTLVPHPCTRTVTGIHVVGTPPIVRQLPYQWEGVPLR